MSGHDSATVKVQAHVQAEFDVHVPEGVSVWTTMLLPDRDCGCNRLRVTLKALGPDEDVARTLMHVTQVRLVAALAPEDEGSASQATASAVATQEGSRSVGEG